jgi:hypothetical protein
MNEWMNKAMMFCGTKYLFVVDGAQNGYMWIDITNIVALNLDLNPTYIPTSQT